MRKEKQSGLTLIEMIVAIAIMAIFLGFVGLIISQSIKIYSKESSMVSLEDQLRAVQDRMIRDIRPCIAASAGSTATSSYLYFRPDTSMAITDNYYEFVRSEKRLYRQLKNGTRDPIADNIEQANFTVTTPVTYTSTPITMRVEVELTASDRNATKTTSFYINLRSVK